MLTRIATKRQKADHKTSTSSRPSTVAQSLSGSLLLHLMRFLNDARSLTAMQSVCRNWRSFSDSQLDLVWRPLYLWIWEAESATDECILTPGESTPWKERYRQRLLV